LSVCVDQANRKCGLPTQPVVLSIKQRGDASVEISLLERTAPTFYRGDRSSGFDISRERVSGVRVLVAIVPDGIEILAVRVFAVPGGYEL